MSGTRRRLLVKDRWFTLVAAVALALGIGVNATVFTFVNAVLLRGLPFDNPDRIMWVGTRNAQPQERALSILDFEDWRARRETPRPTSCSGKASRST